MQFPRQNRERAMIKDVRRAELPLLFLLVLEPKIALQAVEHMYLNTEKGLFMLGRFSGC